MATAAIVPCVKRTARGFMPCLTITEETEGFGSFKRRVPVARVAFTNAEDAMAFAEHEALDAEVNGWYPGVE